MLNEPDIPFCPGPPKHQTGPFALVVPDGAVDTHAHVIDTDRLVKDRSYTPPPATGEQYVQMLNETGMTYGVLIQVSVNGQDNQPMLKVLEKYPKRLRGVAVPLLGQNDAYYQNMLDHGVVGIRVNVMFAGGGLELSNLEECDALARDWGWHVQLLLDGNDLPALMPRLLKMQSDIVIDHMGFLKTSVGLESPGFSALESIVRERAWVKVSGFYRLSQMVPSYEDAIPYAKRLIAAAPDRCIWGSDWPHVATWGSMPNINHLLAALGESAPSEEMRKKILCTNPQHLYGFEPIE